MTREIKFRAWDKLDNGMIAQQDGISSSNGFVNVVEFYVGNEDHDLVLMQFTGLKDKNGVSIFEGDVVQSKNNHQFVIDYQYGSFGATWLKDDSVWYSCATSSFQEKEFIVIGNIYKNPELSTLNKN